jgi:hypothetical protein
LLGHIVPGQVLDGVFPVNVHHDGARSPDHVEKRTDDHIRTAQHFADRPHGGVHHDHVAGCQSEAAEVPDELTMNNGEPLTFHDLKPND